MDPALPPMDHRVPSGDMTVDIAHQIMQLHMDCPITVCPIKSHARTVLIQNGRLRPADRPKFGF